MNMKERIARAMHGVAELPGDWDALSGPRKRGYLVFTDAALTAMCEPTAEMIEAAVAASEKQSWDDLTSDDIATLHFRAMIDAALKDEQL